LSGPSLFSRSSPFRTCLILTLVALAIRLTVMAFLFQDVYRPDQDYWDCGYEQGRVARSIALGKGFSNPLYADTGPTAWQAPVYPYLLAGIFTLFGIYTRASTVVAVSLNCLFAALTCIPLYFFTRRSFGPDAALVAGCMWTIFPYSVYWSIERVWDTWLSTLLFGLVFLVALHLQASDRPAKWAGFGLLTGFAALSNPVMLSVMPGLGLWMLHGLRKQGRRWLLPLSVSVLCAASVLAPWTLRNYRVFHRFIPIRDSMGFQFLLGNDGNYSREFDLRAGPWQVGDHAYDPEWARFQAVGEITYFDEKSRQAWGYIHAHPVEYAANTVHRFVNIWTDFWSLAPEYMRREPLSPVQWILCTILSAFTLYGLRLAWKADAWNAWPYADVLLFYPLIFYLTHTGDWYRRPIDPFFVALAANACVLLYQARWKKTASRSPIMESAGGQVATESAQS